MPVVGSVALAAPHKMSIELFSTVVIVDKSYGELCISISAMNIMHIWSGKML